jgi:hypothetical protein
MLFMESFDQSRQYLENQFKLEPSNVQTVKYDLLDSVLGRCIHLWAHLHKS